MAIITTGSTSSELSIVNGKALTSSEDIGVKTDSAAVSDTADTGLISLTKRGLQGLTTLNSKFNVLGQTTKNNSVPVTLASDQPNVNVNVVNQGTSTASVFGETMVVQKNHIISLIYAHGLNFKQIKTTLSGTATTNNNNSMLGCVATGGSTSISKVTSLRRLYYQAGVGLEAHFSAIFQSGTGNTLQEIGLKTFDESNGFTFAYKNGVLGINYTTNSVTTFIAQSSFNTDKIDGTGTSGFNIDPTKLNLFKIEAQYLGAGDILFYVKPSTSVNLILVHRISYTNQNTVPNVRRPYYVATMIADNTNNTSATVTMYSASFDGSIQGYKTDNALVTPVKNTKSTISSELCVVNIQNNGTVNSVTNNIPVRINFLSVVSGSGNGLTQIRIVKNGTIGGTPSYTNVSSTDSVVSYDTAGTTISGGTEVFSCQLYSGGSNLGIDLSPYNIEIYPQDIFSITAQATTGSAINVGISVSLMELW